MVNNLKAFLSIVDDFSLLLLSCISFFGQLTDFGLSKVGLINSTDDLSGPAVSGTSLFGDQPQLSASEKQQERREKRSAVGTPDYLAPEILLGTGHGLSHLLCSVFKYHVCQLPLSYY